MLFHVRMDVAVPHDLDPDRRAALVAQEKERALELQRSGVWPHPWRVVGEYSNVSIFAGRYTATVNGGTAWSR